MRLLQKGLAARKDAKVKDRIDEVADLLTFFDALTDWDFVCDERFSDPFGQIPMHEACPASP